MGVQSNTIRQLNAPVVRLTGEEVDVSTGRVLRSRTDNQDATDPSNVKSARYTTTTIVSRNNKEIVISKNGNSVTHQGVHVFRKRVILEFVPVYNIYSHQIKAIYSAIDYALRGSQVVTKSGGRQKSAERIVIGKRAEVYFSLNGKPPKRTKSNLWLGAPITIKGNPSGMNEAVLKAKTYYDGKWSEVITVRFRITKGVRSTSTYSIPAIEGNEFYKG